MKDISYIAIAVLILFVLIAHSQQLSSSYRNDNGNNEVDTPLSSPAYVTEPENREQTPVQDEGVEI